MNIDSLEQELDRLYQFEISEYISRCDELKRSGYKIFRNSDGLHKVRLAGQKVERNQGQYNYDNGGEKEAKKENILIRAKNKIQRGFHNFKSMVGFIKFLYANYKTRQ
jgi:hypothetical protein